MTNITLTTEEKQKLEARHKKCRDKRECDRIKAVLLSDEGWSLLMIAQALRIHETSIKRHLEDFIKKEKLAPKSGGSDGHLNKVETQQLIQHLCVKTYSHQHEIIAYIKSTFHVEFTVSGMNKWLHRHGFSYKKPKGVPHKFDEEKQAEFIKHYETLKNSLNGDEPPTIYGLSAPNPSNKNNGWLDKKGG